MLFCLETIKQSVARASEKFKIDQEELISNRYRDDVGKQINKVRDILFWTLKEMGIPYIEIARQLGFNHSSVRYAHLKILNKIKNNETGTINLVSHYLRD